MDFGIDPKGEKKVDQYDMVGRVFFGLYGKAMPETVQRFLDLCIGDNGEHESGILFSKFTFQYCASQC